MPKSADLINLEFFCGLERLSWSADVVQILISYASRLGEIGNTLMTLILISIFST